MLRPPYFTLRQRAEQKGPNRGLQQIAKARKRIFVGNDVFRISLAIDELLLPYTIDNSIFIQIKNQDLLDHIERAGTKFYRRDSGKFFFAVLYKAQVGT